MIRFNYHAAPFARWRAERAIVPGERLRLPLALLAAVLVIVGVTWSLEGRRLGGLERELGAAQARVRAATVTGRRAEQLAASVTRLRELRAQLGASQQAAVTTTNAIARIGNTLPPQMWLTAVRSAPPGTWSIAGRSTHLAAVGTLLRELAQLDEHAAARLVSLSAVGRARRTLDFLIAWERRL